MSLLMGATSSAAILGCAGTTLTAEEVAFFKDVKPWGFILFKRNIADPEQVRALTAALRDTVGRPDAPILIDQEGGRVARLQPPHWRIYPPGRAYGELVANDPLTAREITRLGARLMAHDLHVLGINVDCAPVLDVPDPKGHEIIGDRAYGDTPEQVATLGRAAAEGLLAGGVLPIIKHIPGHGRALSDSHLELPVVKAKLLELEIRDFAPFRVLSDMPMAMTAHVVYAAIDRKNPATTSKKVIKQVIRGSMGFDGLLMSDDLSMKALTGDFKQRAKDSLSAGCDVVLHCNGDMDEMKAVMSGVGKMSKEARRRAQAVMNRLVKVPEPFDPAEARARFDAAFGGRYA
ncbi:MULTISPECIES: beta-N-acetylhexosaminidase [Caulobacter]|jgi:beta-N-acetylhexosaminidase|nr:MULTISPECIES: beta-N-acetylhexosaminidase [Caulobacter]MBQ1560434.1 beta-N-acetylhexosaminidase [Caulobacter sp.]